MPQMVKSQQPVEEHEDCIRNAQFVLRQRWKALELPNHVIRQKSHRTAGEWWKTFDVCWAMLPQEFANYRKQGRVAGFATCAAVLIVLYRRLRSRSLANAVWPRSQERIAPDLLAAFDGFEQESMRLIGRHAQKGRDRGLQIV